MCIYGCDFSGERDSLVYIIYVPATPYFNILTTLFPLNQERCLLYILYPYVSSSSFFCFYSRIAIISFSQYSISFQVVPIVPPPEEEVD